MGVLSAPRLQDVEAERQLVSRILQGHGLSDLTTEIRAPWIADPELREVLEVVLDLWAAGEPVELSTVAERLRLPRDPFAALSDLLAASPGPSGLDYWAARVREAHVGREVTVAGLKIQQLGGEPRVTAEERISRAMAIVAGVEVGESSAAVDARTSVESALRMVEEEAEARRLGKARLRSELPSLDDLVPHFRPGGLTILAGRPSMGKTALGTNVARRAARAGFRVLFVSLETTGEDLTLNMSAQAARMDVSLVDRDPVAARQAARVYLDEVEDRLHLVDRGVRDVSDVRRMAHRVSPDLIVVDYLQLLQGPEELTHNPTATIGAVSVALKRLAVDQRVHVLSLAQLSRACETRNNSRPVLSDLRQSGQIEQDADTVLAVFRDDYYQRDSGPPGSAGPISTLEVLVLKNRRGATGTASLAFDRPKNLIEEIGRA